MKFLLMKRHSAPQGDFNALSETRIIHVDRRKLQQINTSFRDRKLVVVIILEKRDFYQGL